MRIHPLNLAEESTAKSGRAPRSAVLLKIASGLVLILLASGCSSSGGGSSPSTSASASGGSASDPVKAYGATQVAKWTKTNDGPLPTSSPKPQSGKKVWVISCGQASISCKAAADAAMTAGKLLSWDMTLYDGKLSVQGWTAGVQAAVAAHADGVVLDFMECPLLKQPLTDAKKAGIKVVGISSFDCNDPNYGSAGTESLFSVQPKFAPEISNTDDLWESYGKVVADWLLSKAGSEGNFVTPQATDVLASKLAAVGFAAEVKAHCPSCKLHPVPYTLDDYATGKLKSNFEAMLNTNRDINGATSLGSSQMINSVGPALANLPTSRRDALYVMTGEGTQPMIAAAQQGKFAQVGVGAPYEWWSWLTMDSLNREFAGQPQVSSGAGLGMWTVNPNVNINAEKQSYEPPASDYIANYKKIWGVS